MANFGAFIPLGIFHPETTVDTVRPGSPVSEEPNRCASQLKQGHSARQGELGEKDMISEGRLETGK